MAEKRSLTRKLKRVPEKPGAYLMRNDAGSVIYVGKAKRLRSRVSSYFGRGQTDPKGMALREKIADFEYIVTDSEIEALILELHLIKEHRPRYNVNLRDDKRFPYIKVTLREAFPRIFSTRRVEKDGSRYFGPYTDAKAMRHTLRMLKQVFPVRSCRHNLPKGRPERPCLNYEIMQCVGACREDVDVEEYSRMIKNICAFLSGRRETLAVELERDMEALSEGLEFERAARVRDQLESLRKVTERQKVYSPDAGDRDVVVASVREKGALGLVLKIRDGKLVGKTGYPLSVGPGTPLSEVIATFLKLYYGLPAEVPREIVVGERPDEQEAIEEWLRVRRGRKVSVIRPQRGQKRGLVRLAERNADLLLVEHFASKPQGLDPGVEGLGSALGLEAPPIRVEGFDVSNLGGSETVASLVVFENGKALKGAYRNFCIRDAQARDDYAALGEAVGRRYRRVLEEKGILPDLILVDGGKGQVSVAAAALRALGLEIPVVGLAKEEERIFRVGRSSPVSIARESPAQHLLERIRDEAHRVAVSHHRGRRLRALRTSDLDNIRGVGLERRRRLLKHFGSLRALAAAAPEEIEEISGIGPETARRISAYLGLSKE